MLIPGSRNCSRLYDLLSKVYGHFGSKTLRQQRNAGHFGSTADVSYGHFGSAAEVSRGS